MMGSKAFESPLISHARMRGLYRALVETRALSKGRGGWPRGMEACWVGTALDLHAADLTNDSAAAWLTEYARALGGRADARGPTAAEVKKARKSADKATVFSGSVADRMLCAVGQAMALKSLGQGVVIAYAAAAEMPASEWRRVISATGGGELPLVIVVAPSGDGRRPPGSLKIPVIPVDAGDAVAIYRVAQESIGRARTDGRMAIIECVDCGVDPVALMGSQLIKKGICTQRWVAAVESSFRKLAAAAKQPTR